MRLPGQLPLEQAQVVAQALVAELAQLRVLVQAAVLELVLVQLQELALALVQVLGLVLELARLRVLVRAQGWKPSLVRAQGWKPAQLQKLAVVPESPQSQEPAVGPEQARELRISRQLEPQRHRLLAAAQEPLPCQPVLPMKAPC